MKQMLFKTLKRLFQTIFLSVCTIAILLTIAFSSILISCKTVSKLKLYKDYYNATEELLDSLESEFNWIDRYDGEALYKYEDAVKKI